ncbi:MAG: hypothetical protein MRERC_2c022 [Mycoplasmataceae bacterium RC_NB112A]|nr:MAG: hypothetical protein MRERC_6c078 [Mycoplasmataceae bacterium RC_NB112A]KLL02147.1 MAG: hypothetical protein MRERC_4c112 [Mycoplasmataceae bacterium RC_NB112A]KLL02163.1 MAG: hypothetical protein MRERC_4c131 [Mycoplasmataceae bacterium RC_NB112A]KLL02307.1 MAG: hypothetical protein MRERC_2c022 [Mycoplasmataceae bacterium RC_NB112A]
MNKENWKILGQDESQIKPTDIVWEETKTLTDKDIDKGICEICGASNRQKREER